MLLRRVVLAGAYAVVTMLLLRAIAQDIDGAQLALEDLGAVLPDTIQELGPDPANLALFAIGVVVFALAVGAYLVNRETGTWFALLAVSTAGWFLFPYAEVPWVTVFTGSQQLELVPPAQAWVLGGLLVAIATTEMVASAREALVRTYTERSLDPRMVADVRAATLSSSAGLLAASLAVGVALAFAYAQLRNEIGGALLREPSLLWVPAGLGLAAGVLIWWTGRAR